MRRILTLLIATLSSTLIGQETPGTYTWVATGSLQTARQSACAVPLKNGSILVAGGLGVDGALASTEIYGPDDASRRLALQSSARANEAYETLRDPAARGEYLLSLSGIASLSETDTAMPMDFLAEQMERREAIDEARDAADHAGLEAALDAIVADARALEAALAVAIDDRGDLVEAKSLVRKLRFLQRVRQEITDALIEAEA